MFIVKKYHEYNISESIQYHVDNNLSILESVFRIESESWISMIQEVRSLYDKHLIELNEVDTWLINETSAGQIAIFENETLLLDVPFLINEAEYQGKDVKLNKPFRTPNQSKKYAVYTKNDKGNVVKVRFGDPNSRVKNYDKDRAKNFQKRHKCEDPGPKWKAKYWSCNLHRYAKLLGLKSERAW